MADNDNRISFPPTEVDFADMVGTTGQEHDTFPKAGQQPRYDWMRLFLIGLLSNQASEEAPTQFRTGTIWFNKTKMAFFVYDGNDWVSLANLIALMESSDGSVLSLAEWFSSAQEILNRIQPRITYSGTSVNDNVTSIPVPVAVQERINDIVEFVHPLVYINGILVDPRNTRFKEGCPNSIELLNDVNIDKDQRFTVIIEAFDLIVTEDVIAS